jgi:hypothetical protein
VPNGLRRVVRGAVSGIRSDRSYTRGALWELSIPGLAELVEDLDGLAELIEDLDGLAELVEDLDGWLLAGEGRRARVDA